MRGTLITCGACGVHRFHENRCMQIFMLGDFMQRILWKPTEDRRWCVLLFCRLSTTVDRGNWNVRKILANSRTQRDNSPRSVTVAGTSGEWERVARSRKQ